MGKKKKLSQSEIDGVQYRRAKLWQIVLVACNALVGMSVYSLIGMASYSASIGYGISTAVVGVILTCTRILDGVTDPILAFVYDKVDTKFGRLRILLIGGYVRSVLVKGIWNCNVYSTVHCLRYRLHHNKHDSTDTSSNYDQRSKTASNYRCLADCIKLYGSNGYDGSIKYGFTSKTWWCI